MEGQASRIMSITFISLVLFFTSVIIHELGHVVFSKLSGCEATVHLAPNDAETVVVCERAFLNTDLLMLGGFGLNFVIVLLLIHLERYGRYWPLALFYTFMLSIADLANLINMNAVLIENLAGYIMAGISYIYSVRLQYSAIHEEA